MEEKKHTVAFHIGRGGRFNNQGHKTFMPYVKELSDCFGEATIISDDFEGNQLLDQEWQLVDRGGNVILKGRENIENEVGYLNWDNDYDTDIVKYIEDCDDEEIDLLKRELSTKSICFSFNASICSLNVSSFFIHS